MPNLCKHPEPRNKQAICRAWSRSTATPATPQPPATPPPSGSTSIAFHILSQRLATVRTHLAMLGYGLRHRDRREVTGQPVRLLVAGAGSVVGRYALGETGDALTPMAAPADLQPVLTGTCIEVA